MVCRMQLQRAGRSAAAKGRGSGKTRGDADRCSRAVVRDGVRVPLQPRSDGWMVVARPPCVGCSATDDRFGRQRQRHAQLRVHTTANRSGSMSPRAVRCCLSARCCARSTAPLGVARQRWSHSTAYSLTLKSSNFGRAGFMPFRARTSATVLPAMEFGSIGSPGITSQCENNSCGNA